MSAYKFISKSFYSNCFFEALKAKLLHFSDVSVKYIPHLLNCECLFGHFYWINKKNNKVYEFSNIDMKHKGIFYPLIFKGHIMESSRKRNEAILNMNIDKRIKKIEKEYQFTSYVTSLKENNKKNEWKLYDKGLPPSTYKENNPFDVVLVLYRQREEKKIALFHIDSKKGLINPNGIDILYYKIIDDSFPL